MLEDVTGSRQSPSERGQSLNSRHTHTQCVCVMVSGWKTGRSPSVACNSTSRASNGYAPLTADALFPDNYFVFLSSPPEKYWATVVKKLFSPQSFGFIFLFLTNGQCWNLDNKLILCVRENRAGHFLIFCVYFSSSRFSGCEGETQKESQERRGVGGTHITVWTMVGLILSGEKEKKDKREKSIFG